VEAIKLLTYQPREAKLLLLVELHPSIWHKCKIVWKSKPGFIAKVLPFDLEGMKTAAFIVKRRRVKSAYVMRVEQEFEYPADLLIHAMMMVQEGKAKPWQ